VTLTPAGKDAVKVSAAKGRPASPTLKVSIAYRDGWTAAGTLVIAGPGAADKARRCGEMIRARLVRADSLPSVFYVERLGTGDSLPGVLAETSPREAVLRIYARDANRAVVERFSREFAPLVTSGPPGVTGYTTGRPTVREVFAYWPALVPRDAVRPSVELM
jgi:hypothetical protein